MLRRLRQDAGPKRASFIAEATGIAEARVIKIFSGAAEAHRPEVAVLVESFSHNQMDLNSILDAYDHRNEPSPPLPAPPGWLGMLRIARYDNGQPSLRVLAARTELSHGHVGDIFKGKGKPSLTTLHRLLDALTQDQDTKDEILAAYEHDNPPAPRPAPSGNPLSQPSPDAFCIAAAINNLADAIRSLNR